jgi:PKD repeat protein
MNVKSAASLGLATALGLITGAVVLPGCEEATRTVTIGKPEFHLRSSADEIVVGEIVTFTTRSSNVAGRPTQIEWSTTGGQLSTEVDGQVARVQFERPGTYTVTARLLIDNQLVESDSKTVKVRSLQPKS